MERNAAQQQLRGSINHKMPPFPCNVLFYSKNAQNASFKLIRFSDQKSFDSHRNMSIAMVRVILVEEDLNDVPDWTLVRIYNSIQTSKGESPIDGEAPRNELQGLAFGILHDPANATPYEEITMGTSTAPETGTPANKTEAKAAERKAALEKKAADKQAKKDAAAAKRADGVIGNIKSALETDTGTTANELLDKLEAKFPDRTREGMSSTVKIQFSRLAKSTGREIVNAKIVGRGRVYKFADKGPIPGVVETEAPAPAAAAPAAATTTESTAASTSAPAAQAATAPAAAAKAAGKKK
jgi:hypothetical protein